MEVKVFLNRVTSEEFKIVAPTLSEAEHLVRERLKGDPQWGAAATRFVLTADGHDTLVRHVTDERIVESLRSTALPEPNKEAILSHYVDELQKAFVVMDKLACSCLTTEDIMIEDSEDFESVRNNRDLSEEYEAFMNFVRFARRALNLPDVLSST